MGRLVWEELGGGGVLAVVEVEALEGLTVLVWMLAALLRLEPKPRLLKRELMTSTAQREKGKRVAFREIRNWGAEAS